MTNKGKDIKVWGQSEGTVYVTAIYRNEIAECRIQVRSSTYLRLQYDIFFTYPGARGEGNKPIEVEYEVRPYTNQIMWNPAGYVPDVVNTIAVVTPAGQDFSTGKGKITITPLNEGSFELIGTMSGKIARMTVIIQNVYRLNVSNRQPFMQPEIETKYTSFPPFDPLNPQSAPSGWDYENRYETYKVYDEVDQKYKIGSSVYLPFTFCPPDHRPDFTDDAKEKMDTYGIRYEISPVLKISALEGKAIIKLTVTKEIPSEISSTLGLALPLGLWKPYEDEEISSTLYSSSTVVPNNYTVYVKSQLPRHQTMAIPVFQKVYGNYSNAASGMLKYKYPNVKSTTDTYKPPTGTTSILTNNAAAAADAAASGNSLSFDINMTTWKQHPTGVLPEFNNASYSESTSYYIPLADQNNTGMSLTENAHRSVYNLEIGDGEEHYILLDQTHAGMYFELVSVNDIKDDFIKQDFYKDKQTRAPKSEKVDLNGRPAIRISGGDDFVVYDNVLVKNRRKLTFEFYGAASTNSTERIYNDVSDITNFINNKSNSFDFNEDIGDLSTAVDYTLVKQFGIPLRINDSVELGYKEVEESEESDVEENRAFYELDDELVLNPNVRHQIVYLRWGTNGIDKARPRRVQYNYIRNNNGGINTETRIVGAEDQSYIFTNAKNFFKEGPLYVTRFDKGVYSIKINTGADEYYTEERLLDNSIAVSRISTELLTNHDRMVELNEHFSGNLCIVSDFDLGAEQVVWYEGYFALIGSIGYPSNNTSSNRFDNGSEISIYMEPYYYNYATTFTSNNFIYLRYGLFDIRKNKKISSSSSLLYDFFYDWSQDGPDGIVDWFFNVNEGRIKGPNIKVDKKYVMYENGGSLFGGLSNVNNQTKNAGNYFTNTVERHSNPINTVKKVNWRAIQSALIHNDVSTINDELKTTNDFSRFKELIAGKETAILPYMFNDKGTMMFNKFDTYKEASPAVYYNGREVSPEVVGNEYKLNTLYVKREYEQNHNKIYELSEFGVVDNIFNINMKVKGTNYNQYYLDRVIMTEDITGTGDGLNYAPASSDKEILINEPGISVPLIITYKNSYSPSNTITINVKHKIRSNESSGITGGITTTWDKVKLAREVHGKSGFSILNPTLNYFFEDREY